jgi:hypothetical protein
MDRAVAAGCLVFLKRAVLQPESRVLFKLPAFVAEFFFCLVMIPAEDTDHIFNGLPLPFHAGVHTGSGFLHNCSTVAMPYAAICAAAYARINFSGCPDR